MSDRMWWATFLLVVAAAGNVVYAVVSLVGSR